MPNTAKLTKTTTQVAKDQFKELPRISLVKESDSRPSLHLLKNTNFTLLSSFKRTVNLTTPSSWELEVTPLDHKKLLLSQLARMANSFLSPSLTLGLEAEALHPRVGLAT